MFLPLLTPHSIALVAFAIAVSATASDLDVILTNRSSFQLLNSVRDGYTLDSCRKTSQCQGERRCYDVDDIQNGSLVLCRVKSPQCVCIGIGYLECTSEASCQAGDVCVALEQDDGVTGSCLSKELADNMPRFPPGSSPIPKPSSSQEACECGLTLDRCQVIEDCKDDRMCKKFDGNNDEWITCISSDDDCQCVPDKFVPCSQSSACPLDEVCAKSEKNGNIYCASRPVVEASSTLTEVKAPSPKPQPSSVQRRPTPKCVDARALAHFRHTDLVYQDHSIQPVLCDENGSCATAGHVVVFEGKAMMMKTYCALSRCDEREMLVNSPRYRRRLLVDSKTVGLSYTVFAARYGTELEERILQTAVRVGL